MSTLSSPPPSPVPDYIRWPHAVHRAIFLSLSLFLRLASLFLFLCRSFALQIALFSLSLSLSSAPWTFCFKKRHPKDPSDVINGIPSRPGNWSGTSRATIRYGDTPAVTIRLERKDGGDRRDDKRDARFTILLLLKRFFVDFGHFSLSFCFSFSLHEMRSYLFFFFLKKWECYFLFFFFFEGVYSHFCNRSRVLLIISFDV